MWPLGCEGVTAPGTREGSHSDARGDLPEAWASAPHRDAAAAAGRVSLFLPADLPLCDFSRHLPPWSLPDFCSATSLI